MVEVKQFRGVYRFLSNFYPCNISYAGRRYPSAEHAYQASKTTDFELRHEIACQPTPGKAKAMGKKLILRDNWEEIKLDIMGEIVRAKFFEHEHLAKLLVATGSAKLIEGNTWGDTFWGVCNGQGLNHLGRILMETRSELNADRGQ